MNRSAYVVLVGHTGPPPSRLRPLTDRLRADGLVLLMDAPGLTVFGDPGAAHLRLPDSGGLIWGHLFDRRTSSRITASKANDLRIDSNAFLSDFWGGYLAILRREDGIEILRDPSGSVSCYHAELDGLHVLTSRPALFAATGLLPPAIDWTIVTQALVYRDLRPAQTALRGISELLPGTRLHIREGQARSTAAWSPWTHAWPEDQISDMNAATEKLREALGSTLKAWSRCFSNPLLEISGGLDSSIVAAGLAENGGARCLTFGPAPGDSNELPWARAVTGHLGLELVELQADETLIDISRSAASDLPRPCARILSQALDRQIQDVARAQGADAFIGGGGGDSMFCLLNSALPVVDRYQHEGLGAGLFQTAADMAQVARTDIWTVLRAAIPRALRRQSRSPKPMTNPFVRPEARRALPWPAGNPWIEAPVGIAPGKQRHIWSILAIYNHLEGYGREAMAPYLAPLMSQPIFETCMAIPSWLWCQGGNNRAVAREATRSILPAGIIHRRTKVSFNGLVHRVIEANLPVVREMILDGALVREGIIDREAVDAFLRTRLASGASLPEIMALVDIEAWAAGWKSV